MGQIDNAMKDLDQAIAMDANAPTAYFWRGQVWRRKGDLDRALDDLSRAVAQAPKNDISTRFARAQLFSARGDYARALADVDAVLAITPDNAQVKQFRESTLSMQTELSKARAKPAP